LLLSQGIGQGHGYGHGQRHGHAADLTWPTVGNLHMKTGSKFVNCIAKLYAGQTLGERDIGLA